MKKTLLFLWALSLPVVAFSQIFTALKPTVKNPGGDDYFEKRINFKIKPEYRPYCEAGNINMPGLQELFHNLDVSRVHKKFPHRQAPERKYDDKGRELPDLSLIYAMDYQADYSVFEVAEILMSTQLFEYAEPHYISYPLYTPNDPNIGNQYHLTNVQAYCAWDSTQGDTTVIIGITDTSFDVDHEDLVDNVKYNYNDPINGIDDDSDTYLDNYAGWDFYDDDNDLYISGDYHGTPIAALAAATTDNNVGIAGIGFKCKFLPVKAGNATEITFGYEAMVYAAEKGAKVINCSWGNATFNNLAQDVVDDVTLNFDALVVAAAGNNSTEEFIYPASYEYVISVTGVDANDIYDNGSNAPFTRSDSVDLCAPGFNVYSTATLPNGSPVYSTSGGSSLAAPIVSGAAALVRSRFPSLDAIEVGEKLKDAADNIYNITENMPYVGKLGTGRLNVCEALTDDLVTSNELSETARLKVEIFPNPASEQINIQLNAYKSETYQIQLFNATGQLIWREAKQLNKGQNLLQKDVQDLPAGSYFLHLSSEQQAFSKKIFILQ